MSGPLRKSLDPEGEFTSPFNHRRTDVGYDNLKVKLLTWPDEDQWKVMASVAGKGHSGAAIDLENLNIDEIIVEDAWKGGLAQIREAGKLAFLITGCSRAVTHEIVRTRVGAAYIQQTMRHTNMTGDFDVRLSEEFAHPKNVQQELAVAAVELSISTARAAYQACIDADFSYQAARDICPIGTETWILVTYDVKAWLDMYAQRACQMFLPQFVKLTQLMKEAVAEKASWIAEQALITCERPQFDGTHMCTYMGTEVVEGYCTKPWSQESNRVWKSAKFKK